MKNFLLLSCVCVLMALASGCEDSDVLIDPGYQYYPVSEGKYVIYEVDSIVHDAPVNVLDTFRYFIKELNDSTFFDNENRSTARIERFYKQELDDPWQIKDIWFANRTNSTAEKVEENLRYVKLAFPVSLETDDWDGNAQNSLEEWEYRYTDIDVPAAVGDTIYEKSCTVVQRDRVNAIERTIVDALLVDRPADLVVAGRSSDHGHDVVAVGFQSTGEGGADEARGPGNRNAHALRVRPICSAQTTKLKAAQGDPTRAARNQLVDFGSWFVEVKEA